MIKSKILLKPHTPSHKKDTDNTSLQENFTDNKLKVKIVWGVSPGKALDKEPFRDISHQYVLEMPWLLHGNYDCCQYVYNLKICGSLCFRWAQINGRRIYPFNKYSWVSIIRTSITRMSPQLEQIRWHRGKFLINSYKRIKEPLQLEPP